MRPGIRGKLFLLSLVLLAAAFLAADLALTPLLDRHMVASLKADLLVRARLAEPRIRDLGGRPGTDWQAVALDLAARASARVTLVDRDGRVLGDSEVASPDVARMENHLARPELRAARGEGDGGAVRASATLGRRMLYVAHALPGPSPAYVRLALPLAQVDAAVARLRGLLVAATAVALAVAGLVALLAAHRMTATLRTLAGTAQRMVKGHLAERSHTPGTDEIAALGRSLDHLASSLSETLARLEAQRDLLEAILEGMQEGVLLLDGQGRVLHANPALRRMLPFAGDPRGRPLLEGVRHAGLMELLWAARDGEAPVSEEIEVAGSPGLRLLVQASRLAKPGHVLAVLVDVTRIRHLEAVRRDFVANASHELRTPVASIVGAVETLQGAPEDAEARALFLDLVARNARRLHRLVEDLLDLSRLESRQADLQPEPVALGPFALQVVRNLGPRGPVLDLGVGAGLGVLADRGALEQVLANLLDNAAKYGGGRARLEAVAQGPLVRVSLSDEGPGIPRAFHARLFERFYRVDVGRSRDLGGTGLGLAIVKHLVEAMGGRVRVEGEGPGATFCFTLPAAEPPAEPG